jgi:hypothetical protein
MEVSKGALHNQNPNPRVRTFELHWKVFYELLAFWWGVDGSRMGRIGRVQMRGSCGSSGLGEYVAEWLMTDKAS